MRGTIEGLGTPHSLVDLLPSILQDDEFVVRWMQALDEILAPIQVTLDSLEAYFDPMVAPDDFLEWLSGWIGATAETSMDEQDRRRLLAATAELYGIRGTVEGLWRILGLLAPDSSLEIDDGGWVDWSLDPAEPLPVPTPTSLRVTMKGDETQVARARSAVRHWVPAHVPVEFSAP